MRAHAALVASVASVAWVALPLSSCSPAPSSDLSPDAGGDPAPGDAFWEAVAAESLAFEFAGRLNDQATGYDDLKVGRGTFTAKLAAGATAMDEGQRAWLGEFPDACSEPALCGREYVVMSAYATLESGAASMTAIHVNLYAMVDEIEEALAAGSRELPFGDGLALLHQWEVTIKPDGTRLDRICTIAIEGAEGGSRLFVGGADPPGLAVGEPLHLWGNVALATDAAAIAARYPELEEDAGLLCEFLVDDAPATAEEYAAALAADGPPLSCELPEGYLDPFAADRVALTFAGAINPADVEYPAYGAAAFAAEIGGAPVGDALYSVYATRTGAAAAVDYVAVTALDDVVADGPDAYLFTAIGVEATAAALVAAEEAGEPLIGAGDLFVWVADAEQLYAAADAVYTRLCPIAVSDPAAAASSLYVCVEAAGAFAVGDPLELAGNVAMTADPEVVAEASGLPDGESCFCSLNEEAIPCAEYP